MFIPTTRRHSLSFNLITQVFNQDLKGKKNGKMPSGKRNATPGPSNLGRRVNGAQDASASPGTGQGRYNNVAKKKESKEKDKERQRTLKRPGSEDVVDEDEREKKKSRFGSIGEENCDDDVVGPKDNKERDKKRKRRRRRKKPSSVAADGGETSQREMSLVALRSSSEMGLGGSHGAEPVNFPPVGVDRVEKQKTPSHTVCSLLPFVRGLMDYSLLSPQKREKARRILMSDSNLRLRRVRILFRRVSERLTRSPVLKSNWLSSARQVIISVFILGTDASGYSSYSRSTNPT